MGDTLLLYALNGRPTAVMDDGGLPSDFDDILQAERAKTAEYRALGILHELWLFSEHRGALLLCEAETLEDAQAISASYPMVQAGYITHEIEELQPSTVAE